MYQHILVAIDGTACGDAAIEHGLRLAREQRAGLRFVHVLTTQWLWAFESAPQVYVDAIDQRSQRANQVLSQAMAKARQAGIEVATAVLVEADAAQTSDLIATESERWPADLVVIGSYGGRGLRDLVLGNVAEGVVQATSAPVLLVRASPARHGPRRVARGRHYRFLRSNGDDIRRPGRFQQMHPHRRRSSSPERGPLSSTRTRVDAHPKRV
ncbi:MAG TPA: universal stress protein [bacterium]|nr:universal stress protein [bacterium]